MIFSIGATGKTKAEVMKGFRAELAKSDHPSETKTALADLANAALIHYGKINKGKGGLAIATHSEDPAGLLTIRVHRT